MDNPPSPARPSRGRSSRLACSSAPAQAASRHRRRARSRGDADRAPARPARPPRPCRRWRRPVVLQCGYGASGLPHMGTFGEVARPTMVRTAFRALTDDAIPTRLIVVLRRHGRAAQDPRQRAQPGHAGGGPRQAGHRACATRSASTTASAPTTTPACAPSSTASASTTSSCRRPTATGRAGSTPCCCACWSGSTRYRR